ncbi:MAG: hypothetical protein ISS15_10695 [Alphaproteobacteria bacterium]|nr:hypothetical protein [Alphaproteobacteria bacterium]MBL6940027.1 hypothetical protein [Alphaproteobacteria bacterium]MBL7098117.1 hypothetical protein [Alphaproteobacteria bacterium]
MASIPKRDVGQNGDDLLRRLQALLYEYETRGEFERARPHILWLMELAEKRPWPRR